MIRLLAATTVLAVIDFPEQVVVALVEGVARVELEGFLICLAGVVEPAQLFVPDAQVVPGGRVGWIGLGRPLPAISRFFPEALLRDRDAELHLRLRLGTLIRQNRRSDCGYECGRQPESG